MLGWFLRCMKWNYCFLGLILLLLIWKLKNKSWPKSLTFVVTKHVTFLWVQFTPFFLLLLLSPLLWFPDIFTSQPKTFSLSSLSLSFVSYTCGIKRKNKNHILPSKTKCTKTSQELKLMISKTTRTVIGTMRLAVIRNRIWMRES